MTRDTISETAVIDAPAVVVFGLLADPAEHAAIDGTGWVGKPLDNGPLTAAGQIFRMSMYHADHPDGGYQTANRVQVIDRPHTISWETGYDTGNGDLRFGGWVWRYDLAPAGPSSTAVTLSYDWSAVPSSIREYLSFPPFARDHLASSLAHLAELAAGARTTTAEENPPSAASPRPPRVARDDRGRAAARRRR